MSRVQSVRVDGGANLWTVTDGDGPPVVLCHGGPGLWDYLQPMSDMLADSFTVHRYDQRGCGRSDHVGPYTIAQYVRDLDALRAAFGHDRWIVGGHSFGARLALHHALADAERTVALVLVSSTGVGSGWRRAYHEERARRMPAEARARYEQLRSMPARSADEEREVLTLAWSTDYADPVQGAEHAREMAARGFPVNYDCNEALNSEIASQSEPELLRRCGEIECRVLVMDGSNDPRPSSATDSLVAALPSCERVLLRGAGHLPWVECATEMRAALRTFLQE